MDLERWKSLYYKHQQQYIRQRLLAIKYLYEGKIQEQIEIEFIYTPPYSPDFNLAEYIIHLLRLEVLHHQPVDTTIQLVQQKLENFLMIKHVQTPEQIQNTIEHIYRLI
ncbi:hypothetical protein DP113_14700 [Brasilonema octagenarum UFV-E1]|uniref:Tc1-like transposase DDE domain-containing protein n=1 Tax=Brasilonema sennae CENA114 TaxID=415709 RepID=A0A856MNK0_9CYAN|nr:hypothetical protein DP114_14760 [Brasilonema sennae CENA114]QDL18638.1 hypothetical protein DP113_14700 [Brasilonema octagenarum UFV-E1]